MRPLDGRAEPTASCAAPGHQLGASARDRLRDDLARIAMAVHARRLCAGHARVYPSIVAHQPERKPQDLRLIRADDSGDAFAPAERLPSDSAAGGLRRRWRSRDRDVLRGGAGGDERRTCVSRGGGEGARSFDPEALRADGPTEI